MLRPFLGLIAAGLWMLAPTPDAKAELIVLSAVDFVKRCKVLCPNAGTDPIEDNSAVDRGVLIQGDGGFFFASVPFPVNGQRVCRFSLVYHDINANEAIVATLNRKRFTIDGNAFKAPIVMATVSSEAGVPNTARKVSTRDISNPTINKSNSFYYVELFIETFNLNVLGVQIDVRNTCPQP